MYELEYPAPPGNEESHEGLPMMIALQGYADAGQAVANSGMHVLEALDSDVLASFKLDELLDYRARRPRITIEGSKIAKSEKLSLDLHAMKDLNGRPFLLLAGPEPDLRWEAFAHAVVELARRANVSKVVTLYAAPMTVPHTRPLVISAHTSERALVTDYHTWDARMMIPGAAALETEMQLQTEGIDTVGLTAHVPHYISASDYPEATHDLLRAFADLTDRELPIRSLEKDMSRVREQLAEQVNESQEISAVVSALERQYDIEIERLKKRQENSLIAPGQEIPTGEELGAEFEQFLARMEEAGSEGSSSVDDDTHPGANQQDGSTDDDDPTEDNN